MKKTRRINQLKSGAILSYVNLVIGMIIPLLYTPIMLRILGQEEYGLYGLSNSVISYLSLLTLGIGMSLPRYLVRYRTENNKDMVVRMTGLFVLIYLCIAVVTVIVGVAITFFTGSWFASGLTVPEIAKLNKLIIIMSVSTAVSLVSAVYSSVMICYERYLFRRLVDIGGTLLAPILNLIMLYSGYASVGIAVMALVLQLAVLVVNMGYCRKALGIPTRFRNLPYRFLKEIFGFTVFMFIGMIADMLYWATDKVLLGAMIGSAAVAVYNVGTTFNSVFQSMAGAVSNVFVARVNELVCEKRPVSVISELMIRVGRVQYLIIALVLGGFISFGQPFVILWGGEGYEEAYVVALITMIPLTIPLIQNVALNTLFAMKRHQFRSILYAVLAVANVVGTYLLIPVMGMVGAAWCTCVVFVIGQGFLMNWFYYKKIGLNIPLFWGNILKMTFVPGVMVAGALGLQRYWITIENIWQLGAAALTFTAIYGVTSWVISMNEYEKDLVRGFVRKFTRKKAVQ